MATGQKQQITLKDTRMVNLLIAPMRCLSFFKILDEVDQKACKRIQHQICDVFVSDWSQFLIHIHDKLQILLQTTLFVDV